MIETIERRYSLRRINDECSTEDLVWQYPSCYWDLIPIEAYLSTNFSRVESDSEDSDNSQTSDVPHKLIDKAPTDHDDSSDEWESRKKD